MTDKVLNKDEYKKRKKRKTIYKQVNWLLDKLLKISNDYCKNIVM